MKLFHKRPAVISPVSDLLNVGCGRRFHPAWVNADIAPAEKGVVPCDLRERLPFADGTFRAVYHSHVLEHLSREEGAALLRECARVLRPAGVLRVVVPDLEQIARLYLQQLEGALAGDATARQRYEWIILELVDQMTREESGGEMVKYWKRDPIPAEDFVVARLGQEAQETIGRIRSKAARQQSGFRRRSSRAEMAEFRAGGEVHRWMYDRYSLAGLMQSTGFVAPRVCGAAESAIRGFAEFGLDTDETGAVRKPDSLFMEAFKPAA